MPETIIDLGKKVKAKYPGQYDDLDDADVGRRVKAKFPGAYDDFSDEIAAAPTQTPKALPASQSPEFQLMFGASPVDTVNRLKGVGRSAGKAGMSAVQYVQHLLGRPVSPTPTFLEPSMDPNQRVGEQIGEAALTAAPIAATGGASVPVQAAVSSAVGGAQAGVPGAVIGGATPAVAPAVSGAARFVMDKLPSKARAGAKFQQLKAAGGNLPIDTTATKDIAANALDLTRHGAGAPPAPIREFLKRTAPTSGKFAGQKVQMAADPVTLDSGLKFSSNAGRVSVDAATKMTPAMKSQLTQFAHAMKTANRETAKKIGMEKVYDEAMKEYARAAKLEEKAQVLREHLTKIIIGGAVGAGGVALINKLSD